MKYIKLLCLALAVSVIVPAIAKKPKDKNKYGVYMTGVSASFTDSLVYRHTVCRQCRCWTQRTIAR